MIGGSILLAFGIDAWWDERQEREEVRQDLANITRELVDNRERIMFQLDLMDRMASGGEAMLLQRASENGLSRSHGDYGYRAMNSAVPNSIKGATPSGSTRTTT